MKELNIPIIEKIIGYEFSNKKLLVQAFTHSSLSNETKQPSYQRLEFLGDAILGYIVAKRLYDKFSTMNEGELSKARANLISWQTLSKIVDKMEVMEYLQVGKGEIQRDILQSGSVKCDLFESILGAILVDSNYNTNNCEEFVHKFLLKGLTDSKKKIKLYDYKSLLLEKCAKKNLKAKFSYKQDTNDGHFIADLIIDGKHVTSGEGNTKKAAEKMAAKMFLEKQQSFFD